jgi:hypothetical protein
MIGQWRMVISFCQHYCGTLLTWACSEPSFLPLMIHCWITHCTCAFLSFPRTFHYRDDKKILVFLSSLMSKGKFSSKFLANYRTKSLVNIVLTLNELPPHEVGIWVGHTPELIHLLTLLIKCHLIPTPVNVSFWGQESHHFSLYFLSHG